MQTRIKTVSWTILLVVAVGGIGVSGCGEKYKGAMDLSDFLRVIARKKPTPPTTLIVSGESITVNDIEDLPLPYLGQTVVLGDYLNTLAQSAPTLEDFEKVARPPIEITVERRIWNILLYQKAKSDAGEPEKVDEGLEKSMKRVWREYVVKHGGNDAEATLILKEEEGLTKKQYLENQKREMLSAIYLESRFRREQPISHIELLDYYGRMREEHFQIKPRLTMRLIDLQPARLKLADPTLDRRSQALALAKDLIRQLEEGADFGDLAKQHSHGVMARLGGLWPSRDPASLAPPYDELAEVAQELDVGQVSAPIVVAGHVFIVRLEEKQQAGYYALEDVQDRIEQQILQDRQAQVMAELDAEIAERAQVGNIDQFVQYAIEVLYRRSARS
jgi:hypothetical protein